MDRILYLDGDIILNKGFEKIFEYDISDCYAAAVEDICAVVYGRWHERIGHEKYFNSGMMLLNLAKMRRDGCAAKLLECKKNETKEMADTYMDQNALNIVLGNNAVWLPPEFNFLNNVFDLFTKEEYMSFYGASAEEVEMCLSPMPYMFHFAGEKKVWKDFTVAHFDDWAMYADPSLHLPLVKNYCGFLKKNQEEYAESRIAAERQNAERMNSELVRLNQRIDELKNYCDALKKEQAEHMESRLAEERQNVESRIAAERQNAERMDGELARLNQRIDELKGRIENTRHRTLYGALAWVYHKMFPARKS